MPLRQVICPDGGAVPLEAKVKLATELKAALANSKLRLYKADTVVAGGLTSLAALEAAECDYDGYTAGGVTIAAFGDPIEDDGGASVLIVAPSKQFDYTDGVDHVTNEVGGAFLVDSDGDLRGVVEFETPVNMATDLDSVVVTWAQRV